MSFKSYYVSNLVVWKEVRVPDFYHNCNKQWQQQTNIYIITHIFIWKPFLLYNRACYLEPDIYLYILLKIGNCILAQYDNILWIRDTRDYILFPVQIEKKLSGDRFINGWSRR